MSVAFSDESDITLHVDCAFGDDPFTASPTWVDISADVRSFAIRRGRDHRTDRVRSGKADVILDNTSGDYTPFNTAGAQTPNVVPMVPFRISAAYTVAGAFAIGDDADTNGILDVGEVPLFTGFVQSWEPRWKDGIARTTRVRVSDAIRLWNQEQLSATAYGPSNLRLTIELILLELGWPKAWINGYSLGTYENQAHTPKGSALAALRALEDGDGGELFARADGESMFHTRKLRATRVVVDTFGDGSGEYRFEHDPKFGYDDFQIWNIVSVTRRGAGAVTQTVSDSASISKYGRRELTRNATLHRTNAGALALADFLLARYKDPELRVDRFTIAPRSDPVNLWPVALAYDVGQKVKIRRTPATGDVINLDVFIEGIEHRVSAMDWETTYTVSQAGSPRVANWTHAETTATTAVPAGGATGDLLVIMAAKGDSTAWADSLSGWSRDYHAEQFVGDNRSIVGYSRAWNAEPADYTLPATADHVVMALVKDGASFAAATATDNQSVTADFDSPSVASTPNEIVFRWAYAQQPTDWTAASTVGVTKLESPGPDASDTGSEEIYWGLAPSGSSTGVFNWTFLGSAAPEIYSMTAVYNVNT